MDVGQLRARYLDFQLEGKPDLTEFLDKVVGGEFGPVPTRTVGEFLDTVEADIISNIETMAAANPNMAGQKDEVLASQLDWLRQIREKYVRNTT